ncbi:uncharacterized protein BDZ99DRAFT_198805 [Mytilinidion resinicola]|uniref:Uncharacterized protein n=1 Tax=Mytilinidion resinicola TaxID=574789 RepID=A0A6A6Y3T3_9PEZI|nr:uncharacterized protein BDZ99DRAFT_198805 [Mytilinidion resinicola]KAF2802684.1 hypothetical protein BDZ99DRAFT_198805 [Mytilinidion resinicola]
MYSVPQMYTEDKTPLRAEPIRRNLVRKPLGRVTALVTVRNTATNVLMGDVISTLRREQWDLVSNKDASACFSAQGALREREEQIEQPLYKTNLWIPWSAKVNVHGVELPLQFEKDITIFPHTAVSQQDWLEVLRNYSGRYIRAVGNLQGFGIVLCMLPPVNITVTWGHTTMTVLAKDGIHIHREIFTAAFESLKPPDRTWLSDYVEEGYIRMEELIGRISIPIQEAFRLSIDGRVRWIEMKPSTSTTAKTLQPG